MKKNNRIPKVKIVILNYNGRDDTLECLESLEKVSYENFHTTIIDNGSTDNLGPAIREKFPQVQYLYSPANLRFAGGNNLALRNALEEGYDYVLLLNNDTVVEPDFLTKMVETGDSSAEIGLVGAKMFYYDPPDVIWFAGGVMDVRFAYMRHLGIGQKDDGSFDTPQEMTFLNGACLLIKSAVLRQVGLLDEDYFLYGEDQDYCIRAQRTGYKLFYQPAARIRHKVSRSTPAFRKLIFRYRSWFTLIRKHTPFYWRPVQYGHLIAEFIPLVFGYLKRKAVFKDSQR
ncbi:MAG: glycosyltransferase family 2 protein [FCB group bacterium]|nr:glycosyltransferase family 2 protein [FCB group bacterium]